MRYLVLLTSICLLAACSKKPDYCEETKYKIPLSVSFKGFTGSELNTIIRNAYAVGSMYTQLSSSDTIRPSNIYFAHDTAYDQSGILYVGRGEDYEIIIPAASRVFRISGVSYSGDSIMRWTDYTSQCRQRGFRQYPDSLQVDGSPVKVQYSDVFLKK